jgi:hypothetical protein
VARGWVRSTSGRDRYPDRRLDEFNSSGLDGWSTERVRRRSARLDRRARCGRNGCHRLVTEGEPIILVQNGDIIGRNLRRERLTHGDLEEEARRQQVASLDDIRWAILEKEGTISIILSHCASGPALPLGDNRPSAMRSLLCSPRSCRVQPSMLLVRWLLLLGRRDE